MIDSIFLNFTRTEADEPTWIVDILRETEKGYDYLGCLRDSAAHDLYLMLMGGCDSNEHRKAV